MRRYELVTVVTNGHRIEGRRGLILAFFGKILAFFGNKTAILQLFTGVTDGHSGHRWSQMVTAGHSWSQNRRGLGAPVEASPLIPRSASPRWSRTGGGRHQKRKRVKHVKLPYMGHLTKYNPILPSIMAVSLPGASQPVRDSVVDDAHDAQGAVCHAVCMSFTVS